MNRVIIRVVSMIILVLMLSTPLAMADLSRGDRGDEVVDLQQLLFEAGWLFELPDGIFGRNTEEAVMAFENYAGLPVDGIADDVMIYELAISLEVLNQELGITSAYFGEYPSIYFIPDNDDIDYTYIDDGDSEYADSEYAECCTQWTDSDGNTHTALCVVHQNLHIEAHNMLESGDSDTAMIASAMWYNEVGSLYEKWASLLPEEERDSVYANRTTFFTSVESQRSAMNSGDGTAETVIMVEKGVCQTLRNQAVWLCGIIWQLEYGSDASAESDDAEPIALNAQVIIDGDLIYYAGNIDGEGEGIYVMNRDGSNRRKISDITATLAAVSNGNLLIWHYDNASDYSALEVLRQDGTTETAAYEYNGYAIAHEGRFYYGGSSVAEDGSDHQWILSSDPEYHENYWPLAVEDGYLYYLDNNNGFAAYDDSLVFPSSAVLNRLNLNTGEIELLSGMGTHFLGIEDGSAYYTRENFYVITEDGEALEVDVDQGLYHMNLKVLAETELASIGDNELVFEDYSVFCDDAVYGWCYDYTADPEGSFCIIGVTSSGTAIQPVMLGDESIIFGVCFADGIYFGTGYEEYDNGEVYYTRDVIMGVDVDSGESFRIILPENETINYTEIVPKIAVIDGEIYYYTYDMYDGTERLNVMNIDGSNQRNLVKSAPMYEPDMYYGY